MTRRFWLSAVAGAGLVGFTATAADAAVEVTVIDVSGVWTAATVEGGGSADGVGTNQIFWGNGVNGGPRSSYEFVAVTPPAQGPFNLFEPFDLGDFVHNNFPVTGNTLVEATLEVTVSGSIANGVSGPFSVTSVFEFAHDETPNNASPSSNPANNDLVTATANLALSESFTVEGEEFAFVYSGFLVGGELLDEFSTVEGTSNRALLQAAVVPLPAALPLMLAGLAGLYGATRRRRAAA